MHKCYPLNDCLEVVFMGAYSRFSSTVPLLLVFLMVTMSWSSVLNNRHNAHTETSLSDVVVAHAGWGSSTTLDSVGRVGEDPSLAIDSNDYLHVTYRNVSHGNLDYMTYDGSSWSTPVSIDSTGIVGEDSSLAIDSNDNLHVIYYDKTNANLEYMTFDGSSWSTPVSLDSTDDVGKGSSLAIDSNDNLHVTYHDATNGNLEYLTYDGSSWSTPATLDNSTDDVGSDSSLAIDSSDHLHVTYYNWTGGNLEYMTHDGSSWSTPVSLDIFQVVGWQSSLAIDSNDNLHVTYYALTQGNLDYMTHDGSSWSTPVSLDSSTGDVGVDPSLAIDSNDNLHVTYLDYSNGNLDYMTYDGSSWSTPVSLDSTDYVGERSSLAIDSNDNLHVAYYDETSDNLEYMTYSAPVPPVISYSPSEFNLTNNTPMATLSPTNTGGPIGAFSTVWGGTNTTLDTVGFTGEFNSIAVDSNDKTHVAYYYAYNSGTIEDLRYGTDKSGSWVFTTLDSTDSVGMYTSIALDSNDNVHISYYDDTNNDLKYATDKSGSWVYTTIDFTGDVGKDTSIAVDSNDSIHISYYDATNSDLKYGTDKNGSWVLTSVDTPGDVGQHSAIATDSNDDVHISYNDVSNGDLKYATDKNGSWALTNIDSTGRVGRDTSIAIDSSDKIHIAYLSYTAYDLKYATDKNGSWVVSTIDSAGYVGWYTSIAIDSNDAVHISYTEDPPGGGGEGLKYITNKNGSWVDSTLISMAGNTLGRDNQMALDSNNELRIVYEDRDNHDLLYFQSATTVVSGFTISPSLSPGLDFNTSSGDISGTPTTILGKRMYTVTGTNGDGSSTALINITVVDEIPVISYSPDDLNLTNNTAMATLSPTTSGGEIETWSIDPQPSSGLSFNSINGEISGIPDALSILTVYTISATNTGGTVTATVNITVNAVAPTLAYFPDSLVLTNNTAMTILSPTNTGGDVLISNIPSTFVNSTLHSGSLQNGYVGQDSSVVIDSNNAVHISYYDFSSNKLQYITNKSGSWVISTLDSSADIVGYATSIALDSNDNVHISYHDETNGDLKYATDSSGAWVLSSIDTVGYVGSFTSIVIDSNGHVHIAYEDSTNTALKYATNSSGAWVTTTVDASGDVGEYLSIDLDSNDAVHISYRDGTNSAVKHATDSSGSWVTSVVDSSGVGFGFTSLSIDSNDAIHIAYCDDATYVLKYATGSSGSWTLSTLTSSVVWFASLSVDSNDFVHIAYADSSGLIHLTDSSGSWVATTADSNTSVGGSSSIVHDSNNGIHISYSDEYNSALKYAFAPASSVGSWSISRSLPSGILFDAFTGNLSGIPTELFPRTMFTITAANSGGVATTFINITVNAVAPTLAYSPDSLVLTNNSVMSTLSPTTSGGDVVTWSIDPEPSSGLLFNTTNGEISGIPDALSILTVYTISATNTGGTVTATVNITVNAEIAVISYSPSNLTLIRNLSMPTLSPTVAGGAVVSWEISPQLPSGLEFGPSNGSVWGASLANMSQIQYTVWANNTGGSAEALLNITVVEPVAVIGYSPDSLTLTRTQPMTPWIPEATGGQVETWEIEPTLPLGLSFSNGVISGTPEVNMTLDSYTIWANNSGGASSANITLLIHEPIPEVSYSPDNIVLTRGQNMTLITASLREGMVAIWEISPSLPDGLVFENGGISGTPVVNFTMTQYTVIAQNSGGSYNVTFNLTVVEPVAILSIESNPPVLLRDNSSLALNITNDGGMVEVWEIYPSLPDGLVMENGSVSGVSLVNQSETTFTIWGNNSGGSNSVTFTLTVQEPEITIVEQLPEQEPEVSINLFILSIIFFVPILALIIVFRKHLELMS